MENLEEKDKTKRRKPKVWIRVVALVLAVVMLGSTVLGTVSTARISGDVANSIKDKLAYENLLQGLEYIEKNRYEQALEYLQATLDIRPDNPEAYATRGSVYIATAEYDKALENLIKAKELYGEKVSTEILLQMASIYVLQEEVKQAVPLLVEVTSKDPSQINAWLLLGQIYYDDEEFEKAIPCFDAYLAVDGEHVTARAVRAACKSAVGDEAGAMEDLILAADKGDEYPEIRTALAQVYLNLGQFEEAIEVYKKIVEADETDKVSRQALAACYLYTGKYEESAAEFKQVIKESTEEELASVQGQDIRFSLTVAQLQIGDIEEATISLEQLLEEGYQETTVKTQLADCYITIPGREKEALVLWDELMETENLTDADLAILTLKAAATTLSLSDYAGCIRYATTCLATENADENARLYRAISYLETEQPALAEQDLNELSKTNPDLANIYYYRALSRLQLENLEGALSDLQICIQDTDEPDIVAAAQELLESIRLSMEEI